MRSIGAAALLWIEDDGVDVLVEEKEEVLVDVGGRLRKMTSGASMGYFCEKRKRRRYILFRYRGLGSRTRMSICHSLKSGAETRVRPGARGPCSWDGEGGLTWEPWKVGRWRGNGEALP